MLKKSRENKKAAEWDQILLSAYKEIWTTPAGKLVIEDLLKKTKPGEDIFTPDPHVNNYMQGRQSIGLHIQKKLKQIKES